MGKTFGWAKEPTKKKTRCKPQCMGKGKKELRDIRTSGREGVSSNTTKAKPTNKGRNQGETEEK